MSYEGSTEYLCANGHYLCTSCYEDAPDGCSVCGAALSYSHSIDETNGVDPEDPGTMPGDKECIGQDDQWREDHYHNRYAFAIPRYKPLEGWRELKVAVTSGQ